MRNYSRLLEPDQLELEQVSQSRKAEQLQQLYFTHHHRTKAISLAEAREVLALCAMTWIRRQQRWAYLRSRSAWSPHLPCLRWRPSQ